ncbi:MAG: hypothetical protein JXM69_01780 [Anaerolineae bacterium]|nr:hypothetical protein [Anaerolineae bacterium]
MKNHFYRISIPIIFLLLLACVALAGYLHFRDKVLMVTVLDRQTGQPIQQAIIEVNHVPVARAADTPDRVSGPVKIELAGNSLGFVPRVHLRASAPAYLPNEVSRFVPWWQKQTDIVIGLDPTQIIGRVVDATTGDPLVASIAVTDGQPSSNIVPSFETNPEGYFEIFRLQPPVTLQVKVAGYKPWQTQLETDSLYANPASLNINLVSQDLLGQVTDARTNTALPATVYISDNRPDESPKMIKADENGHFEATRLEPPVIMRVEAPGYETWQTELTTWEQVADNAFYQVVVNLEPHPTRGVLRAADTNEPLTGLTLSAGSGEYQQTITTDVAGWFELIRLRPGDLITVQSTGGYLPLEIVFNNEVELNLALQPRQTTILVQDSFTRRPAAGVNVTFDQAQTVTTDAHGQAIFSRIPASGQISIVQPGYRSVTVDYQDDDFVNIVLVPSSLQGIVRGGDTSQPLPQATIYLGDTILRADDQGHFVLNLPPMPTQLMVKSAGYHRGYAQLDQTAVLTDGIPPFSGVEGRWLITTPCVEQAAQPGPPCLDFVLEPFQVKAIYVPFHYLRSREAMLRYLDFIQATELNALVVDVKGDFGFIGWPSQVELVETIGADEWWTNTWMPLDELVAEAKRRNIYTVARLVVFKDDPLAHGKPELAAVREDGTVWIDGEELGWANPFKEEVWDYNIALAQEVAACGFDELNFDYIRFPSDGDVGAIVYEEENTLETRTATIREFMRRLTDALRPYGVFVSADVFGLTLWVKPESDMKIGQRVMDIAPFVDYLAPMVYPSTFIPGNLGYDNPSAEPYGIVYRSQFQAEERVPPYVKVRPWLQGYWYSLEEMRLLKQGAIDANSTGWSWWNAGGKYDPDLFEPAE